MLGGHKIVINRKKGQNEGVNEVKKKRTKRW